MSVSSTVVVVLAAVVVVLLYTTHMPCKLLFDQQEHANQPRQQRPNDTGTATTETSFLRQ
jgi:hypothetical protein